MKNIAYLIKESGMGFNEVLDLPYLIFFSLLKQYRVFEIEQTEEGRKALAKQEMLNRTEPDWSRIRNSNQYQIVKKID